MNQIEPLESRTFLAASFPQTSQLRVVLGHDGFPDTDDVTAKLAGYAVARANASADKRIQIRGMIIGDMKQSYRDNFKASQDYYKLDTVDVVNRIRAASKYTLKVQNAVTNFSGAAQWLADEIKKSVDAKAVIVYSAGGGMNVSAEAIARAMKGANAVQKWELDRFFRIIQHSKWNFTTATGSSSVSDVTKPYTIGIEDQNDHGQTLNFSLSGLSYSGYSGNFRKLMGKSIFLVGAKPDKIKTDVSDAGSHDFATTWNSLKKYWWKTGFNTNSDSRIDHELSRGEWVRAMNAIA